MLKEFAGAKSHDDRITLIKKFTSLMSSNVKLPSNLYLDSRSWTFIHCMSQLIVRYFMTMSTVRVASLITSRLNEIPGHVCLVGDLDLENAE